MKFNAMPFQDNAYTEIEKLKKQLEDANRVIEEMKDVLLDFIAKVDSGRARSVDTYVKAQRALALARELETNKT